MSEAILKLHLLRVGNLFETAFVQKIINIIPENVLISGFIYFGKNDEILQYEYVFYSYSDEKQLEPSLFFRPSKADYIYFQIFNTNLNEIKNYYKLFSQASGLLNAISGMLIFIKEKGNIETIALTGFISERDEQKKEMIRKITENLPPSRRPYKEEELKNNFAETIKIIQQDILNWGRGYKTIEPRIIQFVPPTKFSCFGVFLQGIAQMNEIGTFLVSLNRTTGDYDDYLWQYLLGYLLSLQQEQIKVSGEIYILLEMAFGASEENCADYFIRALNLLVAHIVAPNNLITQCNDKHYVDLSIPPYEYNKFPQSLSEFKKENLYNPSNIYQIFKVSGTTPDMPETLTMPDGKKYQFIYGIGERYAIMRIKDVGSYILIKPKEKSGIERHSIRMKNPFGMFRKEFANLKLLIYEKKDDISIFSRS